PVPAQALTGRRRSGSTAWDADGPRSAAQRFATARRGGPYNAGMPCRQEEAVTDGPEDTTVVDSGNDVEPTTDNEATADVTGEDVEAVATEPATEASTDAESVDAGSAESDDSDDADESDDDSDDADDADDEEDGDP